MEKLAIIKDVGFGCRDVGTPCLFFTVFIDECCGALEVLFNEEAMNFIKAYGVYDVKDLEGKPVWVFCTNGGLIKVSKPWREN